MIQDAGGVPLGDGRRMRTGLVFRISGALAGPDELAELTVAGLRTLVDLRSEDEDRKVVIDWARGNGVEYFNFPIVVGGYSDGTYAGISEAIAEGRHAEYLLDSYAELATGFGDELAAGFEALSHGFPCAFGCAAGKDRTGVMSAYLQVLLGASEETAIEAYLAKAPTLDQLRPTLAQIYDIGPGEEIPEGLQHIAVVRPSSMTHAFDAVRAHGGVEAFLKAHGLTDAAIERLRGALIQPPG